VIPAAPSDASKQLPDGRSHFADLEWLSAIFRLRFLRIQSWTWSLFSHDGAVESPQPRACRLLARRAFEAHGRCEGAPKPMRKGPIQSSFYWLALPQNAANLPLITSLAATGPGQAGVHQNAARSGSLFQAGCAASLWRAVDSGNGSDPSGRTAESPKQAHALGQAQWMWPSRIWRSMIGKTRASGACHHRRPITPA